MRAKAQYKGNGSGIKPKEFSERLRFRLRSYCPKNEEGLEQDWDAFADSFVEVVLSEARFALDELYWQLLDVTKEEIQAEHKNLSKMVSSIQKKVLNIRRPRIFPNKAILDLGDGLIVLSSRLTSLSPDYDRLFDVGADPLEFSDSIRDLACHIQEVQSGEALNQAKTRALDILEALSFVLSDIGSKIEQLTPKPKVIEKQHDIAIETAIRILRALEEFGIEPKATYHEGYEDASLPVMILKAIDDDIGLNRSEFTWRDIILKAKREMSEGFGDESA